MGCHDGLSHLHPGRILPHIRRLHLLCLGNQRNARSQANELRLLCSGIGWGDRSVVTDDELPRERDRSVLRGIGRLRVLRRRIRDRRDAAIERCELCRPLFERGRTVDLNHQLSDHGRSGVVRDLTKFHLLCRGRHCQRTSTCQQHLLGSRLSIRCWSMDHRSCLPTP